MAWRDKLLWDLEEVSAGGVVKYKSSFRGAKFFFERSEASVGRRNVVHQYPYKDSPYIEDLGRDTDEFTVDGYVVQNEENNLDYFTERDALINALKEPGPG
ncbi:MAG: DNA circularization N-terminal domain-containing protein, partial [Candidatus Woesearchaeota archaeon]